MTTRGKLLRQDFIRRGDLQSNPDRVYVFGDNMCRRGKGGQAAQMRGEPNAVGIPTKWEPSLREDAFFDERDYQKAVPAIHEAFDGLEQVILAGRDVVWPAAGIGSGLAQLEARAPSIHRLIQARFNKLSALAVE
ncbi:hypothetical protein RM531_08105 [Salinisphaera sp. P385]|uniref:DUF7831 domain-containing protein n=1 Tax=Spectribacter acetivorans TaxID=3075603 RepID=A0ABU3B9E7_9GAMM|nr:hypothetical protein [Salinisphaera sp. P385]MDT0618437.1 hypothetical protein [Salinisphaera sp. P385]